MIWAVIGLSVLSAVLAALLWIQTSDLRAARRRIILLTLAWRQPDSVAGRDILPEAHPRLRYEFLRDLVREGVIDRITWGGKFWEGKRYVQYRYRLLPAGRDELKRRWQ